jgi:regulation of enolase protein 1 (concanavalin A-like superfamily)
VDPLGDCEYSLTANPGHVRLSAPDGGHDLYINLDAPRMVQYTRGDFVASTQVTMHPNYNYQGAGLLIWQGGLNYIRLERTLVCGVDMSFRIRGRYEGIEIPFTNPTVNLGIQRQGDRFTACYSENDSDWAEVSTVSFPAANTLQVGLDLINQWQNHPGRQTLTTSSFVLMNSVYRHLRRL